VLISVRDCRAAPEMEVGPFGSNEHL
jgi:hypothetical protein